GHASWAREMIHVRECPRGDNAYAGFAAKTAAATVYHQPHWLDAVEDGMGLPCMRLLAESAGQPVGMLPLCHVKSLLFGNFLVSVPFGNYGGMAVSTDDAYRPLLDAAIRIAEARGCRWIELRHIDPAPLNLPHHTRKVNQILDLRPGAAALWEKLPGKPRQQVRKAEKHGLTCAYYGREGLDDFYTVFVRLMRD